MTETQRIRPEQDASESVEKPEEGAHIRVEGGKDDRVSVEPSPGGKVDVSVTSHEESEDS